MVTKKNESPKTGQNIVRFQTKLCAAGDPTEREDQETTLTGLRNRRQTADDDVTYDGYKTTNP